MLASGCRSRRYLDLITLFLLARGALSSMMPAMRRNRFELTEQQREKIVRLADEGLSTTALAERLASLATRSTRFSRSPTVLCVRKRSGQPRPA
jgi:hypothetical protein